MQSYLGSLITKTTPKLDIIMAVDDLKQFHQENLAINKSHYTMMNRATKNKVLYYFQNKGAKVHFNYMKIQDPDVQDQKESKENMIDMRYGVIQYDDLIRDLEFWETMLVSTMMQRPIKTVVQCDQVWQHQSKNLRSALAVAALNTLDGDSESKLYEKIVNIPHYHSKYLTILDKEEEEEVVQENYDRFQRMYHPIWQDTFKDVFEIKDNKFYIQQDQATRKFLMSQLNDNVFQNIDKISIKIYDDETKFHKNEFTERKKEKIAQQLIEESKEDNQVQNKEIYQSIDKILIAHRNTKMFLFVMSWQFFLAYFLVKKFFQGLFLYYMYKKAQKQIANDKKVLQQPQVL
ncbi:UNKNOWN [Stylonychia lemnae]|uniref:Phosphatidate cytidylyltransferase, mitochondrial n=1 Tax=Stylonychia lemnae TaxID=5949 RepID=A0A078BDE8_STYLE|nr:UNKNOWN [Stylonychia lemnae]|eukprot:CDW91227.1 UNKNOWN [Stylonychia lemnae]